MLALYPSWTLGISASTICINCVHGVLRHFPMVKFFFALEIVFEILREKNPSLPLDPNSIFS